MKTQYPNSLKKEKYIIVLSGDYQREYTEFLPQQIKRPIEMVVGSISSDMEDFEKDTIKLFRIRDLKKILRERDKMDEESEDRLSQCMLTVLHFLIKIEEGIRYDVSEVTGIPFPEEQKEEYLDFISKMTERVIVDICKATEEKIPHTTKLEYQRLVGEEENILDNNSDEENKNSKTFVERFSKRDIEEEEKSFANRVRKVRFEDEENQHKKKKKHSHEKT